MKNLNKAIMVMSISLFTTIGYASSTVDSHSSHHEESSVSIISAEGKLISIDRENKKLTINHNEIKSINWPPMTMRFTYQNEKMIEGLSDGDNLIFSFIQNGNISLLESIEKKFE
ncbi:copper-binding protein [Providencia alcalifaciens]|uniref:copper-binding protein n=1 Tax=Providencia alcalifaciens TaxID=126385 RepID=UPI001CC7F434|nr:copper-binding protein [Providencia alcalifaciens]CAG9410640.1 Cation efflux system protein CusF [Providencia alcalifaciens]